MIHRTVNRTGRRHRRIGAGCDHEAPRDGAWIRRWTTCNTRVTEKVTLSVAGSEGSKLTAATVTVRDVDPEHEAARHCLTAYFTELGRRFDSGFDPERSVSADPAELRAPYRSPVVSFCAPADRLWRPETPRPWSAEIKRMWVAEPARGLGIGRRLLTEFEAAGGAARGRLVRLETNRALAEAIGRYRSAGYLEVAAFNNEPYAHHWFEKPLA